MSTLVEPRMNDAVLGSTFKSGSVKEGEKETNGTHPSGSSSQQVVPELNVNGSALPKESGSSPRTSKASPKISAAPSNAEQDSGWGSNFWVTLIEPQVRTLFTVPSQFTKLTLVFIIVSNTLLCVSSIGPSQLGPSCRQLRVCVIVLPLSAP